MMDREEFEETQSYEYVPFEEVLKNKEYYANLFSEDCQSLKELLLNLWDRKIETYGCCAGHYDEDQIIDRPVYIRMYVPTKELVYRIVAPVYNNSDPMFSYLALRIILGKQAKKDGLYLVDLMVYYDSYLFKIIKNNLDKKISEDMVIKSKAKTFANIMRVLENYRRSDLDLSCELTKGMSGTTFAAKLIKVNNDKYQRGNVKEEVAFDRELEEQDCSNLIYYLNSYELDKPKVLVKK